MIPHLSVGRRKQILSDAGSLTLEETYQLMLKFNLPGRLKNNNLDVLLTAIALKNMAGTGKIKGNDLIDAEGREYEAKSVAGMDKTSVCIGSCMSLNTLKRYRKVTAFLISVFDGFNLVTVYRIEPRRMKTYFDRWEKRLKAMPSGHQSFTSGTSIPLSVIVEHGEVVYEVVHENHK